MELDCKKMTISDFGIVLAIYEDLAKEHGWAWDSSSTQTFMEELMKKEREKLPWYILDSVERFGKNHPKFLLITKLFCEPAERNGGSADCHTKQDWWIAFVKMLDDTKVYLSEADRKELYQDLQSLIGHRLNRKEY